MSAAEKAVRDRLRRSLYDKLAVFGEAPDDVDEHLRWFASYKQGEPRGMYTVRRMFDGRFWSMQYRWVKTRRRYELVRSSVRHHAKRRDAKARAWSLHRQSIR